MSSEMEALDKAKEAAAEAKERKHLAPVSLTMAILAVLVATVSLLGPPGTHGRNPHADPGHRPVGLLPGEEHAP